mmetsp:Transcript_84712/g.224448  ORF Transcript_84712/g.224448 Transcript_84712/m.224448 type:complete len:374 (+) Transcript_84712:134-1255(+)
MPKSAGAGGTSESRSAAAAPSHSAAALWGNSNSPLGSGRLRYICTLVTALFEIFRHSRELSSPRACSPGVSTLAARRCARRGRWSVRKLRVPCKPSLQRRNSRRAKSSCSSAESAFAGSSRERSTWNASRRLLCPRFLWMWCCRRMRDSNAKSSRRRTARNSVASPQDSWDSSLHSRPSAAMDRTSDFSSSPTTSSSPPRPSGPRKISSAWPCVIGGSRVRHVVSNHSSKPRTDTILLLGRPCSLARSAADRSQQRASSTPPAPPALPPPRSEPPCEQLWPSPSRRAQEGAGADQESASRNSRRSGSGTSRKRHTSSLSEISTGSFNSSPRNSSSSTLRCSMNCGYSLPSSFLRGMGGSTCSGKRFWRFCHRV